MTLTELKAVTHDMGGKLELDFDDGDLRVYQVVAPAGKFWIDTDGQHIKIEIWSGPGRAEIFTDAINRVKQGLREIATEEQFLIEE